MPGPAVCTAPSSNEGDGGAAGMEDLRLDLIGCCRCWSTASITKPTLLPRVSHCLKPLLICGSDRHLGVPAVWNRRCTVGCVSSSAKSLRTVAIASGQLNAAVLSWRLSATIILA